MKVVGLYPLKRELGLTKLKYKENKSDTDTKIENNPLKSAETSVQIFKCHFDPFWIEFWINIFNMEFVTWQQLNSQKSGEQM